MKYLYAIQDSAGREVCSATVEPDKVGDVAATYDPTTETARLFHDGEEIASGPAQSDQLSFLRWKAEEKLAEPVSHEVAVVE